MKSLTDYIKEEQTNEGLLTASGVVLACASSVLFLLILYIQSVLVSIFNPNDKGYAIDSRNIFKQIKHENGAILIGMINWAIAVVEHMQEEKYERDYNKLFDKVINSDEYKEYMKLPKSKRTLKRLKAMVKEKYTKDYMYSVVCDLWEESKNYTKEAQNIEIYKE